MNRSALHRLCTGCILSFVVVFAACSTITSEEPPLSDSTMVELLTELYLADARLELEPRLSTPLPDSISLRDSILVAFGLDEQAFASIMDYYADHPEDYAALSTHVVDRLSEERYAQMETVPADTAIAEPTP